ncbi:glycosyltransferase [Bacillus haimaensis]
MTQQKIPKIIHYCWFGEKEKPAIVKICMESWKKHLTDYQFMEWNETNSNIQENKYAHEAYKAGKFAFVSDYVRVKALFEYGGIYLDTDVEVFKPFDDLLKNESFWGFEQENYIATSTIGAKPKNKLIKEFLDLYKNRSFINKDGSLHVLTNVAMVTEMLEDLGLIRNGEFQTIQNVGTVYPQTYLSPYDYINCINFTTKDTYAMHHYHKSWLPWDAKLKGKIKATSAFIIGGQNIAKIRKALAKK